MMSTVAKCHFISHLLCIRYCSAMPSCEALDCQANRKNKIYPIKATSSKAFTTNELV